MSVSILITDGEERAALALTRSLGRQGFRIHVCSTERHCLAGASRYAAVEARVPSPLAEPAAYAAAVRSLAQRWGPELIVPLSEASLLALLPIRAELSGATLPFPAMGTFQAISDKVRLLAAAARVGIAVPRQVVVASREEAHALEFGDLPFPVVLKPSRSVVGSNGTRSKLGVRYATDAATLRAALGSLSEESLPVMVQQRVVGPGIGIFLLLWEGEVLAVFSHRRLREKPPAGGVSVYREAIPAEPELVHRSRRLLESFGWQGVAMVEYKLDESAGVPYLMEVNGRFWGSLQLAIDAGVDFPVLLARAARGERPEPVTTYRTGVRSRWWWGDVDQLLTRLRHSPERLALSPGAPGRLQAVREFFRWRRVDREEVLRLSDPRPFVRETLRWFRS